MSNEEIKAKAAAEVAEIMARINKKIDEEITVERAPEKILKDLKENFQNYVPISDETFNGAKHK